VDDLDRWTRVLPLGAGAFGEVHLAWDRVDSRWVAVKRFTGQDELGLLRMVIESRIRVSHPHLVRTLAFRLVDDRAWLVTELARGGSLRALMTRTGALPWGWVAEAVDQVLAALTALHASGVVHRDLKPANLLLRSTGTSAPHLLVGDFGIATWRTVSMTGIGAAIGTPGYLAPEYLDGHAPSPATDLFAVGVLAAEMLTGRRQVHYSNASPSMPSSWGDVLPLPADVPAGMAAVLRRMAAPDPSRRYLDCTQAREALLSAVPPPARGDWGTVEVPDLLAAVPPGWTSDGPEEPTKADAQVSIPEAVSSAPNLVGLPIDGGPTALVPENDATVASPTALTTAPSGSATPPTTPPSGSPTPPTTPPSGSPSQPHNGPLTPPQGSAAPARAERKAARRRRIRRKVKQGTLLLTLVVLLAGGGTLWWAATHRGVTGQPSAAGSTPGDSPSAWVPTIVEPCAAVELDSPRNGKDGPERCQRTPDRDPPQSWVQEPPGGFPKSNAAGPFPAEPCTVDGDRDYSPVGDHVQCDGKAWRLIA
jgi:serine/threonine protein kinase